MPLIVVLTIDIKNDNSTRSMANIALDLKSVVKNISTVPLNSLENSFGENICIEVYNFIFNIILACGGRTFCW